MDSTPSSQKLSALMIQLYELPLDHVKTSLEFSSLARCHDEKALLLSSIPETPQPSYRPLHLLYSLLTELEGPWPTIPLVKSYSRAYKLLPKSIKTRADKNLSHLVTDTALRVKHSYSSFLDFVERSTKPALRAAASKKTLTHLELHKFVKDFRLTGKHATRKPTVAIAIPNGPLLAAACVAVTTHYTSAPINPAVGSEQFRADVEQARATIILTTKDEYVKLELDGSWIDDAGIEVVLIDWEDKLIRLTDLDGRPLPKHSGPMQPNTADDIGLILFTSGTSGTKKVVPLTLHSIIAGVVFVMESWGLSSEDICLNMMPLYHVNIFAPIFSGGSTVCCTAFDPNLFWDVVEDLQPTWYYASPSMHSVILAEASARPDALRRSRIRLACNAAGGLLPSLACQLRDTFNCVVLPSYGMTECMPISTPPLNYKLEREGTSGISTGPELTILDRSEQHVMSGTVGRICVRGEPVFPGYLTPQGTFDRSPFNSNGWFDTGDLGYMDDDGYLYITGRSKEVINRGGELISPFEVENAIVSASTVPESPIYGRVSQALAFSASHDVLQEVVGVVLVTPPGVPRVDLRTLRVALRSSLQQAKWPVMITYMDDLPKKNNKVLRIKLGQRLGIPEITDDMPHLDRHWQAICPPSDTALSVNIDSHPCAIDPKSISVSLAREVPSDLRYHFWRNPNTHTVEAFIAPATRGVKEPPNLVSQLKLALGKGLHNYMVPEQILMLPDPFVRDSYGNVDEVSLKASVLELEGKSMEKLNASTEGKITRAFADVLGKPASDIPFDVDFFSLGGDSLRAGKLISMLRATFNVHLPVSLFFSQGTVAAISTHIEKVAKTSANKPKTKVVGCEKTYSSTNPLLMLLQLIPIAIVYPLRRAFQWTIFMVALSYAQSLPTNGFVVGRLINLTTSIMLSRLVVKCVAPSVGIAAKWLIVGRYREGLYPMWGVYHTRWWMVEKIVSISGKGFFNLNDTTKRIYCQLMGAKIGKNVKLAGAALGEWDLLDIRDGATLTRCVCRPFAAEGNTSMYLGRITVGQNASVGLSSIVAAGSEIPANTCIGPNSSSWELQDADEANRDLSAGKAPKPHWLLELLITTPLALVAWFMSLFPWFGGLIGMVLRQAIHYRSPIRGTLNWFTAADRIAYHYLALILRNFFSPFILFAFAILVKVSLDIVFGKLGPSSATGRGAISTWRASLIKTLLPASRLHNVTGLFGQHYEATSIALRMLGSKVGKRVYWPGTGPGIGDYHLLDVGNDVVFGSRAHIITSDGTGAETVTIRDRAMIADRVCLLPGVEIGERATMGSGALTRRGTSYPADSTYVGSKGGDAVCLSTGRQQSTRARIHHMSSDDTLAASRHIVHKKTPRSQIQHMSSDDTLAESRKSGKTREKEYQVTMDFFTSDSETDDKSDEQFSTDDLSPFGRAFYLKLAPYHVMGPFAIFCYSSFISIFTAFFWNVPSVSSIQLVDLLMNHYVPVTVNLWMDILWLWLMSWGAIAILNTVQALMALCIVVAAKWILIGRRQPGNYDWDKSSYCQRWQIFLCVEKLRRQCYRGHGVLGLLTGTSWIVLYFRALGAKIGKDCALFANGRPSLMFTEPDLITLGDRVAVDDASVVAHINTRGKFDLNRLEVGDRCVLRTGSRLLSGASMKADSCLLEHTLIMGGDVVEQGSTMQGWPAEVFESDRVSSI